PEFRSVNTRRQEQNPRFLHQPAREFFNAVCTLVADEADAAAIRLAPLEKILIIREKGAEDGEIVANHLAVPRQDFVPGLECNSRQHLGRRRVAYRQEMLVVLELDERCPVLASQPSD